MGGFIVYDLSSENFFSIVGNSYDLVGALILARALIFVRSRDLESQATSGYGGFSSPLLKMFCEQKVDAIFGLSCLVFGFSLQILGGYGFKSTDKSFLWTFFAILIGIIVAYFFSRPHLTKAFFFQSLRASRHVLDSTTQRLPEATINTLWEEAQRE